MSAAAPRIALIDYAMGNLRSVQKGFEHAGVEGVLVTGDPAEVASAHGIVLPGVGAFRDAAANLRASGAWDLIRERVAAGTPFLGICLGMQLLATVGFEGGEHAGLGVAPGRCVRLPGGVKAPHIGWNTVSYPRASRLFRGIAEESAFYFVHSYHVVPTDGSCVTGTVEYGATLVAAMECGSAHAVQFHPEKSSATGLKVLANFGRIVQEGV